MSIYFEKQESAFCAVHSINNLLQGAVCRCAPTHARGCGGGILHQPTARGVVACPPPGAGPLFTEVDLAQIALEIDERERQIMVRPRAPPPGFLVQQQQGPLSSSRARTRAQMERGTETKEFLTFMAADSANLNQSGNFSIQVIKKVRGAWRARGALVACASRALAHTHRRSKTSA
jgi:hypothetical protein